MDQDTELKQVKDELSRLSKLTEQLVFAVAGNAVYEHKGLLERQRVIEEYIVSQKSETQKLKEYFQSEFLELKKEIDTRFGVVDKIEIYLGLLTNKTIWRIFFGVTMCGVLLITWSKGGYNLVIKLFRDLIK